MKSLRYRALLGAYIALAWAAPTWAQDQEAAESDEAVEELTVTGVRTAVDSLGIDLDAESIKGLPGGNDDVLHVITMLPGVAQNSDFEGGMAVRGSRPLDNEFRVDFLNVGYLFHFAPGSVVDGDVVDGFTFHPAGFGARFQDKIGGVVDVRTRSPNADDLSVMLDANLLHSGVLVEGPVNDRQRGYFSARASYYDLILEPLIERQNEDAEEPDLVQLPRYRDYRGKYQIDIGDSSRVDLLLDGATDSVELLFDDENTEVLQDPALAGQHRFGLKYHRQGAVFTHDGGGADLFEQVIAGFGHTETDLNIRLGGAGDIEMITNDLTLRVEATLRRMGRHQFTFGGTITDRNFDYDVVLRDNGCTEFEVDCRFTDSEQLTAESSLNLLRQRFFGNYDLQLFDNLTLSLGSAYTADDYLDRSSFEPRGQLRWQFAERSTFTAGAGRYHQLPAVEYMERTLGNPLLDYLQSDHYVLGMRHRFLNGWLVKADVYEKSMSNLVTGNEGTRYDNRGVGEARGAELMVQGHFGPRWVGWLSLSYAESERTDLDTGQTFAFEFDQPLIASLVAKHQISDTLSFGARAIFHSGAPDTRIVGGTPDPENEGLFIPIYGPINGDRLPDYFRLDLRLDWNPSWFNNGQLYFEVLNATNRENVTAYEYEPDYSDREAVSQIPVFVSIGVRKSL
ncbi:MAG: TonB-dependent receptor plug domain-containing protein [Gammaproteobacteria bacterium]